ncbi:MAG: class I SAM-dependent RNA methyltransferase [Anaerolineae bacterium]|nr:class I SAM-dependent RNA methyltransferase [Anaerolineae bacterium]
MTPNNIFDVTLLQSVYGGDCLARLADGRALFVPYGLPGEVVRVQVVEEKRSFVRARLLEVLTPAAERITPRCPHFGVCGGCYYQHMPYELQLRTKEAVVREQFVRIGELSEPPIKTIVPSPLPWAYRNTLQFHLSEDGRLGFQAALSHQAVPVEVCYLPATGLEEIWKRFEFEALPGLERIEFRQGDDEDILVVLEGEAANLPEVDVEMPISLVHHSPAGDILLAGNDALPITVLGKTFVVSAASFFQVNVPQAEKMVQYVLEQLNPALDQTILDVYCGVGLFSAFIAGRVKQCIGIELSPSACRDFAVNLENFDNVSLYEGAAEEVLPALQVKADAVVLDPPRAGLDVKALDAIAAVRPGRVIYVSCDPSTLARDVKRLTKNGYRLESVQPFDLFPQTYHVECVAVMIDERKP